MTTSRNPLRTSALISHVRENGFKVGEAFQISYNAGILKGKAEETVTIVGYQRIPPVAGWTSQAKHFFTLSDGSEYHAWDEELIPLHMREEAEE